MPRTDSSEEGGELLSANAVGGAPPKRVVLDGQEKVETNNPLDGGVEMVAPDTIKKATKKKKARLSNSSSKPKRKQERIIEQPLISKVPLLIVNFLFLVLGIAIIAVGAGAQNSDYSKFLSSKGIAAIIVAGVFIMLTALLGFGGAVTGKARFLVPYVVIVFANFLVQVVGAALLMNLGNALSEAKGLGLNEAQMGGYMDQLFQHMRTEMKTAFTAGGCSTSLDGVSGEYSVACTDTGGGSWIASFVNGYCEKIATTPSVATCFNDYSLSALPSSSGMSGYCMCKSTVANTMQEYSQELYGLAITIAVLEFIMIVATCHTLCQRKNMYRFVTPADEGPGGDPNKGGAYAGVFPLLYGTCVGFRQLIFFAALMTPTLFLTVNFLDDLLPQPSVSRTFLNATQPLTIDTDHCQVSLENDFEGKLVPEGQVLIQVTFGNPRAVTGDPNTYLSFCGDAEDNVEDKNRPKCKFRAGLEAPNIGVSRGCTNYTASGATNPHWCVMNIADKTFIDAAYTNWDCTVNIVSGKNTVMPNLKLGSTESVLYAGLPHVAVTDVEIGARDDHWSNARYHFCSEQRRLKLSSLSMSYPDAQVELDCFDMAGELELVDLDESYYHIFADAASNTSEWKVDATLAKGDLYLWSRTPVALSYNTSGVPADQSSLCTVGDAVLDSCAASGTRVISATGDQSTKIAAAATLSGKCAAAELKAALASTAAPGYVALSVVNNIATAGAYTPPPVIVSNETSGNATNATVPPADKYFNHVQVEAGVFVDTVYDQGKTFVRDVVAKKFTPRATQADSKLDGNKVMMTKPSFSDYDKARLTTLFHHETSPGEPTAQPSEDVVTLDVMSGGIPLGTFKWYKNIVYSFIPPSTLAFISLNLLNPTTTEIKLELVNDFCPLPYMQNLEAEKEVLNAVYETLFAALEPLPEYNVFTFAQMNRTYQGFADKQGGFKVATNYVFQRDDSSPTMYRLITQSQAISESFIFRFLISINITLTLVSALLFAFFAIKILAFKRRGVLRELVSVYRADLGNSPYVELEKELKKKEMQSKFESTKIDFIVMVRTGNKKLATTNGRVFVTLVGAHDETREIELEDSMGRSLFNAGCTDQFAVTATDVGDLLAVRVRHEMSTTGIVSTPSWYLDSVVVLTPRMTPSKKPPFLDVRESFEFPCGRWFAKSAAPNGVDEGNVQMLDYVPSGGKKSGGMMSSLFGKKKKEEVKADSEEEEEEDMGDITLDEERRTELIDRVTAGLEPRASPFWMVDTLVCVKRRQAVVRASGSAIPPSEVEETVKMFKSKLMGKYMRTWKDKVETGRSEIQKRFPQMKGNMICDDNGDRIVDPKTGECVGKTLLRQGVDAGYRAKVVLMSELPEALKASLKRKKQMEMEANFALFDTSGTGELGVGEVRVAMLARGIQMKLSECTEIISDLDLSRTGQLNLAEYMRLIELTERERDSNYEAVYCFKLFMDEDKKTVTFKQLKRVVNELGEEMDDRGIQELLDRADLSGEGEVHLEDFLTVMGQPNNEKAQKEKIAALPIPDVSPKGDSDSLLGAPVDDAMFRRIVFRYWRRYALMTDPAEKKRYMTTCAFAARPGNFLDKLPSKVFLRRCGLSLEEGAAVLQRIRMGMRLESFYAYFELSASDKKRYVQLLLRRRDQYFEMGVTKRSWFVSQSMKDREFYLNKKAREARARVVVAFFSQLLAELQTVIMHIFIIMLPPMPLFAAAYLYDANYKKYHPFDDKAVWTSLFKDVLNLDAVYVAVACVYLIWFYLVKNIQSRQGREGPVEKRFRQLYYVMLFITMFFCVTVVVCCFYWIVLGTVLKPSALIPVFVAVAIVAAFGLSLKAALSMFRRVCTARMDDFKDQGQTLKKDAVRFKMQVTKRKAEMMAEAEKSGKPFKEAGQFQKVQDSTRNSMMQVGRLGSAGEQFFVSKGLTQADILVGVRSRTLAARALPFPRLACCCLLPAPLCSPPPPSPVPLATAGCRQRLDLDLAHRLHLRRREGVHRAEQPGRGEHQLGAHHNCRCWLGQQLQGRSEPRHSNQVY